jgi:hypothetical protein
MALNLERGTFFFRQKVTRWALGGGATASSCQPWEEGRQKKGVICVPGTKPKVWFLSPGQNQGQNSFVPLLSGQNCFVPTTCIGVRRNRSRTVSMSYRTIWDFFSIERDWPSRLVLHVICKWMIWTILISQRDEMRTPSNFIQEWFFTRWFNGFIFTLSFSHKKKWRS